VHPVARTLLNLSRTPRPAAWDETLLPLAAKAIVAETQHATDRLQFIALADVLCLIDPKPLVQKVRVEHMADVGALLAAGKNLRGALDGDFTDLRDAIRDAASATQLPVFTAAIERGRRYLRLAESTNAGAAHLVEQIEALLVKLDGVDFVSTEIVVPKREATAFFASTGGAA
jgi:hypothetical protein